MWKVNEPFPAELDQNIPYGLISLKKHVFDILGAYSMGTV